VVGAPDHPGDRRISSFGLAALIGDRGDPTYMAIGLLAIIPAALCSLLSIIADERPGST
jgi:uncharacterized membrane-anchored protein